MSKKSDKKPWGMFFWADYLAEPKLKICSLSAQGLWMRMLCIAAQAKPLGYVVLEGNALGATELAAECGKPLREVTLALAELQRWGVFSVDRRGRIYSRRMLADIRKAKIARENGKSGGNPALGNRSGKSPSDNPRLKPQSPESRTRVKKNPQTPRGGLVEFEWNGPSEIRALVEAEGLGGYLGYFTWRDVPERALVTNSPTIHAKLKAVEPALREEGVKLLLEKGKAA